MLKTLTLAMHLMLPTQNPVRHEKPLEEIASTIIGTTIDFPVAKVTPIAEFLFVCNRGRPEQAYQWTYDYDTLHPTIKDVPREELKEIILFSAEYRSLRNAGTFAMNVPQFADMHQYYFRAKRAKDPSSRIINESYLRRDSGDDFGFHDKKVNAAIFYTPQVRWNKDTVLLDDNLNAFENIFYWTFGSVMAYLREQNDSLFSRNASQEQTVLLHSMGLHLAKKISQQYLVSYPDNRLVQGQNELYRRFEMQKEVVSRYIELSKQKSRNEVFDELGPLAGNEAQIALYERFGGNAQIDSLMQRLDEAYGVSMINMVMNTPSAEKLEKLLKNRETKSKKRKK